MKKIITLIAVSLLLSSSAFALNVENPVPDLQTPGTLSQGLKSWWNGPYFTGDWDKIRTRLATHGIEFVSTYVIDTLGSVAGGKRQSFAEDSSLGMDLNVDFEKAASLKGLQFHVSMVYRQGNNLASDIGNKFPPSSIYGSEQIRLYNLYVEQAVFDDKLSLKFGRLGAGDDFAQSPLYWTFLTNSIDGCPINLPINFFFTVYPTSTWGARLKFHPTSAFMWKGGIYHQDSGVGRNAAHGADFTWRDKGLLYIQELSYLPNQYPAAKGMPGNYKLGLFYSTGDFKDQYLDKNGSSYALTGLPQRERNGNYGLYFHADQQIYREPGPKKDQGLTPLFVMVFQPTNVNQIPFFFDGGLIYKGLVPKRDDDVTAVGFAWGAWSRNLNKYQHDAGLYEQKYEVILEATYKIAVNQWLYIQPDVQYIINPSGGTKDLPDALVIGARTGVTF